MSQGAERAEWQRVIVRLIPRTVTQDRCAPVRASCCRAPACQGSCTSWRTVLLVSRSAGRQFWPYAPWFCEWKVLQCRVPAANAFSKAILGILGLKSVAKLMHSRDFVSMFCHTCWKLLLHANAMLLSAVKLSTVQNKCCKDRERTYQALNTLDCASQWRHCLVLHQNDGTT